MAGTPGLLEGKTAAITGGAAGIGGGISRRFAAEGATVVINDIDPEWLADSVATIEAAGGRAVPYAGDIRDREVVAGFAEAALDAGRGHIDVLVNNVGDFRPPGRFLRTGEDRWQAMYEINLLHVFRCTKALAPAMVAAGTGSIVNVSTVEAHRGIPANAVYSAFNAGVEAFTRSLAVELGREGVRVNAIAPDLADTPQTPAVAMLGGRPPEDFRHWVPLGRPGAPEDYGDVALFLASDLSRFVTGSVIPVDGGTLAASGWYLRDDGRWTNMPAQP